MPASSPSDIPWVQLYTPINEMFICAVFSAKYGWWNEQKKDDKSFVTAIKHLVKANVMGMIEILKRRHDAIFIQSESSEYYHADSPAAIGRAEVLNQMRFLSLDLNYGRRVDSGMYQFLLDSGMTREEYEWFLEHRLKQHCILGNDYYQLNEHRVFADGHTVAAGETFGYSEITRQYYNRYRLPVMHTETNLWEGPHGDEAVKWLWKEWANVLRLSNVGIPTVGFTWYSLTDQVDWDTALREQNGNVNPLGLFDLDRKIRNVGKAYKQLIADWRNVLPAQSVCLIVPIKKISELPRTTMTMRPDATSTRHRHAGRKGEGMTSARSAKSRPSSRRRAGCSFGSRPRMARSAGAKRASKAGPRRSTARSRRYRDRFIGADPFADRGHLAGRLPRRLLPRRGGDDVGAVGPRAGAVGPQGPGARPAGVADARRQGARQGPFLRLDRRRPPARDRRSGRRAARSRASTRSR